MIEKDYNITAKHTRTQMTKRHLRHTIATISMLVGKKETSFVYWEPHIMPYSYFRFNILKCSVWFHSRIITSSSILSHNKTLTNSHLVSSITSQISKFLVGKPWNLQIITKSFGKLRRNKLTSDKLQATKVMKTDGNSCT